MVRMGTLLLLNTTTAQNLLGCTAVFLIECQLTFRRYVLPPSSGPVCIQLRARHYIPEDSELHIRRRENLKSHTTTVSRSHTHFVTLVLFVHVTGE
jgi:hypothetical protein